MRGAASRSGVRAAAQTLGLLGVLCGLWLCVLSGQAMAQPAPPELTQTVNDFTGTIDGASRQQMDQMIRSLQQATGDVVVVAVVDTFQPYGDIREYAVKMFENHGRGIGQKGKDNGLLILVALKDRGAWIEVGYELEQFITDGFSGETVRQTMAPYFRKGEYGPGLVAAVSRIIGRIAEGRNVTLSGVKPEPRRGTPDTGSGGSVIFALFVLFIIINAIAGRLRRRRRWGGWGGGGWSGWSSGVGPFGGGGGGFGGGFGGFGGGGGGFGGFGGGRSGGGGGGGSW